MDLVTVTCWRDHKEMILQAESIQKFLKPCTHWVIINDLPHILDDTKEFWYKSLPEFYSDHNLKILVPEWNTDEYCTWERQQMLKYWIYQFIKDDYLILDSKNFFIKDCSLEDWKNQLGCGLLQDYETEGKWMETSQFYAKPFNSEIITNGYSVQTPFVFKKQVLEKIKNVDKFSKKWINKHLVTGVVPSEFLYYSYLDKENLKNYKPHAQHYTVWPNVPETWEEILEISKSNTCKIFGMHRTTLENYSEVEKNQFKKFLTDLGFQKGVALIN